MLYTVVRKQNNGSTKERQLPSTCAGDCATYTTEKSAPLGILYPFFAWFSSGIPNVGIILQVLLRHRVG